MEWGEAIAVNGVRPDWLRDAEPITVKWTLENVWSGLVMGDYTVDHFIPFEGRVSHIKLPVDHPYYTVQAHNAKHGTNFAYWPGGDNAPDDWDGGPVMLLMHGEPYIDNGFRKGCGSWSIRPPQAGVIGYTRKALSVAGQPEGGGDYVSVKRMTEWQALFIFDGLDALDGLRSLGLIRPETREERFTRETGFPVWPDVRAALEWSKEND